MNIVLLIPIVLGWLAGLAVNYLSDVLPITRSFSQPTCPNCQTVYSWTDYLTLRACRSCGRKRTLRTWLVQFLGCASFAYFWLFPPKALGFILGAILLIYFGMITVIDLEHRLILHPTSIAGAVIGLGVGMYMRGILPTLIGGAAGFGIMFILYQFGAIVSRMRARRMQSAGQAEDDEEALGGGDVYLAGILGLALGWPLIWFGLLLGVVMGGIISILLVVFMLIRRRYMSEALMTFIPYGPYFILSAFIILFLPDLVKSML